MIYTNTEKIANDVTEKTAFHRAPEKVLGEHEPIAVIVISAGIRRGGAADGRRGGLRDVEPHLCLAPTTVTQ